MKIYVAGASRELARAERAMRIVRDAGHEVAHDWTKQIADYAARGYEPNRGIPRDQAVAIAEEAIARVTSADLLWCLLPWTESVGIWWEVATAHHAGLCILTSGPGADRSVFLALARHSFATDDEAATHLKAVAETSRGAVSHR